MSRPSSGAASLFERAAVTVLPILLGGGVFAVAFVHVHDVAVWAGQPGWAAWLIAMTGEAMAIAGLAAITSRRRADASINWAVFVVICAVFFSGACNLTAVLHRANAQHPAVSGPLAGQPGVWVGLMAVWPVVAFGLVAGLKATKPAHADQDDDAPSPALRLARAATTAADNITGWGPLPAAARPANAERRGGGTVPAGGHMATTAATVPPVAAGSNGASGQVGVVVPVAAAWTRTGLAGGEDDPAEHNGQHNDGHTLRPATGPVDDRPAPAPTQVPPPRQPLRDLPAAPTPPTPPAPVLAPPVRRRAAETTGPRMPAVQFRAPEPPAPAVDSDDAAADDVDVADLLPHARKVRDELAKTGQPLNRATLHAGLKERGQKAGTRKLDALLKELRPEPVGAAR